jgi:predicted dehydrogenase
VRREKVAGDASYTHQLRAFARHVRAGEPITTDARDAVANMRVVDAVYRKAGLPLRGT